MLNDAIKWGLRFLLLIALQVLILDGVEFSAYLYPMVYVFFILMLPIQMAIGTLMFVAFLTGLTIDIFSDTAGMHASACVVMVAFRPFVTRIIEPPTAYDDVDIPGISNLGLVWFITYSTMLLFVHHLVYFTWEIYSFKYAGFLIGRTIFSTLFSLLLIITLSFLAYNKVRVR